MDDRWYNWRVHHWGTKWDCYDLSTDDCDLPNGFEASFNTAWSPPEEICYAIREKFEGISVSWFYDRTVVRLLVICRQLTNCPLLLQNQNVVDYYNNIQNKSDYVNTTSRINLRNNLRRSMRRDLESSTIQWVIQMLTTL